MFRLGGRVLSTEQASAFSSEIKEEQVEDSIRILSGYSDVIVIRHHAADGARRAAQGSSVPVINAGDGNGGQHPTQALLDLYTIYRERPINGLSVAFIGELDRGRTARSLAYLLAKFERVKIFFVAPSELQMKPDILDQRDGFRHGRRAQDRRRRRRHRGRAAGDGRRGLLVHARGAAGRFIFVGNGDTAGLHHPGYDFNDAALPYGMSYWAELVESALAA